MDADEPRRVALAARDMGLKHVVVTSVARDELADEGATHFADTIRALRDVIPGVIVEVLTPDFKGKRWCIRKVVQAHPDIYNHNIETVERLSPVVRPQARYERTLDVLRAVKNMDATIHTKSGIMLGLGETHEEIVQTLRDLREAGVSAVTIGQYLAPSQAGYLPVVEFVHPDRFAEYERIGERDGLCVRGLRPVRALLLQRAGVLGEAAGRPPGPRRRAPRQFRAEADDAHYPCV